MNELDLLNTKEPAKAEQNWISKKELMNICKCDAKTLERIIAVFTFDIDVNIKNHIKKGGYRNLEVFYDDYLVRLIQAKLLSNQVNQGNSSDEIKELVTTAVKNELTKTLTKEEIRIELAQQAEYTKKLKELDADGKYMLYYIFNNPTNPRGLAGWLPTIGKRTERI